MLVHSLPESEHLEILLREKRPDEGNGSQILNIFLQTLLILLG